MSNKRQFDVMLKRADDMAAMVPYWDKSDAMIEGIDALRMGTTTFLPKFTDEDQQTYDSRLSLTKFTNVYQDIVENLASKPFEEEATLVDKLNQPQELISFIEDVDGAGNSFHVFLGLVFYNAINSAIDWIHVDAPKPVPGIRTRADEKIAGIRPYWSRILARNMLEARVKVIAGREMLVYARILEPGKPDHVRVIERSDDGAVSWSLYVETERFNEEKQTAFVLEDEGTIGIDEIPIYPVLTGRRKGRTFKVQPPMKAAVDLSEELYQQESGLKFAKTLTAYPMLTGNGVTPEKEADGKIKKIAVGPNRVLYAPANGSGHSGTWTYVEPSSESLKFLSEDVDKTTNQIRDLGRQPLTAQSSNLTVITTAYAAGKAKSAVGSWALALKDTAENALRATCKFMGLSVEQEPTVQIYVEFDSFIDGKDYDALRDARDAGDISQETYWEECKRRGLFSAEFTSERERKRLLDELPSDEIDMDPADPLDDGSATVG